MKKFFKFLGLFIAFLALAGMGCKKKAASAPAPTFKGTYFSIRQFAADEWNTYANEPFLIIKTLKQNGKTDSLTTNSDVLDWTPIFKIFFETDISDPKFLGQYKFTHYGDPADDTYNLFYETDDEDLLTQKLLITIDRFSQKIKGIYIETYKKTISDEVTQKLYYAPMHMIQIQTDERPLIGSKKYTVLQYNFIR